MSSLSATGTLAAILLMVWVVAGWWPRKRAT